MVVFSPELNAILEDFSELEAIDQAGGKASAAYQHVREYLEKSEVLLRTTEEAIAAEDLKRFSLMAEELNGAASYAPKSKTVNFKLSGIESAAHEADMIFGFGHEVGHANNYYLSASIRESFEEKAKALAQQEGIRDYTPLIQEVLEDHARDEGLSQFAGWDALVSYLRKDNPELTLQDIYAKEGNFKLRFFNDDGQLKEGYQINADLSFDRSPENMAAIKEHFFEPIRNATGVGDAGYRDQYSRYYIERYIKDAEDKNPVKGTPVIDMQGLGLSPQRTLEIQNAIKTIKTPEQVKEQEREQSLELIVAPEAQLESSSGDPLFDALYNAALVGDEKQMQAARNAIAESPEGQVFLQASIQAVEAMERQAQVLQQQQEQTMKTQSQSQSYSLSR